MDKIQKFLVTAGRKDLAQEYYEKTAAKIDDFKKIHEFSKEHEFNENKWNKITLKDLEDLGIDLNDSKVWDILLEETGDGIGLPYIEHFLTRYKILDKYPASKKAYIRALKQNTTTVNEEIVWKIWGIEYKRTPIAIPKYLFSHFPVSKLVLLNTAKRIDDKTGLTEEEQKTDIGTQWSLKKYIDKI